MRSLRPLANRGVQAVDAAKDLKLPVEHVLVSHGAPVVGDGRRALEQVL